MPSRRTLGRATAAARVFFLYHGTRSCHAWPPVGSPAGSPPGCRPWRPGLYAPSGAPRGQATKGVEGEARTRLVGATGRRGTAEDRHLRWIGDGEGLDLDGGADP